MSAPPCTRRTMLGGGFAMLAGSVAAPALALPGPPGPVRRAYLDTPQGQVHVRIAGDKGTRHAAPPLVLLHQTPLSGRMFERIMPILADARLVIAVDTPGYGESDRPSERPALSGYGDRILAALRSRFGRRFDMLGYHTGAVIAAELAARTDAVRRLVLVSVPLFDEDRRTKLLAQLAAPQEGYAADGAHLLPLWTGTMRVRPEGQTMEDAARLVAEKLRAGPYREWALRSAMELPLAPILRAVRRPTLVLAPHDGVEGPSAEAARLIADATLTDLPQAGYGLFDAQSHALAAAILPFLAS